MYSPPPFPKIFRRFGPQIWYFLIVPFYFLAFVLIYMPSGLVSLLDMPVGRFEYNLTTISLMMFAVIFIFRMIFYSLRSVLHLNWWWYIVWCAGEVFIVSVCASLYLYSAYERAGDFFELFLDVSTFIYLICVVPYAIFCLALSNYGRMKFPDKVDPVDSLVRFTDENLKLKLVVASSAVMFVQADENYIRINYLEGDAVKEYVLRNSMKGIEPLAVKHGFLRCHRSYFVNPAHVELLRKDKDGAVYAQFGALKGRQIPVSRKYYDAVASVLV